MDGCQMTVPIFQCILNIRSRTVSETQKEINSLTACHTELGDYFVGCLSLEEDLPF